MIELSNQEIARIVNRYIGVSGGYLGDFSYRTHADFYPEYCDLDIDPYQYEGTTRERFITILKGEPPLNQAKILRGVVERFSVDDPNAPPTRTPALRDEILRIADRLEGNSISNPTPVNATEVVRLAIADATTLLSHNTPISAVDRIHTALHGYLKAACDQEGIEYNANDSIPRLWKLLRQQHSAFQDLGARGQDIERILQSFAGLLDAFNSIRNNASLAHPNDELIGRDEAMLAINAAKTLLHYLDAKLRT